ncbi:NADP(H)-dependent aldo-keto reductase [Chromatocurvus halotolerans]|uniref:Protein tas n=1 Tax=Chromatocurvus halotolerans TaxID=1132028 RepID=A0A4R2KXS8_9GAMM|nr:NADP(H)-dependent aldo-keto reductase [Chromatocurvus halotolerans]TCO76106.1 aryl-alcohol dehydrogenase-like predicted oxidoreductase [Chromatocurvus halotolerans]
MQYRKLGNTDIDVSVICLGTMTYGQQNSAEDAAAQLDYALSRGVNFIDTAEMYPVPPRADTQGETERFIGQWLARSGRRNDIVLATKVAGRGDGNAGVDHLRGGPRLDRAQIHQAIDDSLSRLQTDHVDLYQVHWPERATNFFGRLGYLHRDDDGIAIEETLSALGELVQAGKVRHVGISNETPWGVLEYLRLAREKNLPRIVSIQNPYNLLNRAFEVGLAEIAIREQVGLLAYSPLAFGMLSGKYLDGALPADSRLALFERFSRYGSPEAEAATAAYVALAREHGLDPAQMALAFVNSRQFTTANIIGATTADQLRANIDSIDLTLEKPLLKALEALHRQYCIPAP